MLPLVSVICLCHNHEKFVEEALRSVLDQTYGNIQVIVVDDKSTDGSRRIIESFISKNPEVQFLPNEENIGNCRSFNKAFAHAKGSFIIDFATDDVMLPQRIANQVNAFLHLGPYYGVLFSNAVLIDEKGRELRMHDETGKSIPSGNIYKEILGSYFISPPTMMIRREVLEDLGGYDETLAYEDFDFWVRSSRSYSYFYQQEALTKRRIRAQAYSWKFYEKGNTPMAISTYRVILKALWLNKTGEENKAIAKRIRFELRQAFFMQNELLVKKYVELLKDLNESGFLSFLLSRLVTFRLPVYKAYKVYLKFKAKL